MSLTIDEAENLTYRFLIDYPGTTELVIKIRNTKAELFGTRANEVPEKFQAGYLAKEIRNGDQIYHGQVYIALEHIKDGRDLVLSLRHEILGHYALNTFTTAEKDSVLQSLADAKDEPVICDLWAEVQARYKDLPVMQQAEEVYALNAEKIAPLHHQSVETVMLGRASFNETCLTQSQKMAYSDLDNIANMVAQGISDRSRQQQNFPQAPSTYFQIKPTSVDKPSFSEQVAERLIKQIEAGTAPWQRPWGEASMGGLPMNPTTGNRYKGINVVNLISQGRDDPRWMTYKQAADMGAQVRKGEKGTSIQFWSFPDRPAGSEDKPLTEEDKKRLIPFVRYSTVFNAEQIDGLPVLQPIKKQEWEVVERAERVLLASGANIVHKDIERAYYAPTSDRIVLPNKAQFSESGKYYATALHELGHWTGHESRLDRKLNTDKFSQSYAVEELRAEISSMIMGAEIGTGHDPSNHVAYVAGWVKAIKDDPTVLFKAAADAEKIQTYILQKEKDYIARNELQNPEQTKALISNTPPVAVQQIQTPYSQGKLPNQANASSIQPTKVKVAPRGLRM